MSKQKRLISILVSAITGCGLAQSGLAQSFSYDGNRWYEMEVTVFTHDLSPTLFPEQLGNETEQLVYPQNIRQLRSGIESIVLPEPEPVIETELFFPELVEVNEEPLLFYGPENTPSTSQRILQDLSRDSYTLLGPESNKFQRHNSRLSAAPEHKVLFHAVWRQPVMDATQALPIAISGGSDYGSHHELEGYIQFSFNDNRTRVNVDANLWLMEFVLEQNGFITGEQEQEMSSRESNWEVSLSPAQITRNRNGDALEGDLPADFNISQVWQLEETRPMISNNLHYLDHPRLGLLVEVRPYELPE